MRVCKSFPIFLMIKRNTFLLSYLLKNQKIGRKIMNWDSYAFLEVNKKLYFTSLNKKTNYL